MECNASKFAAQNVEDISATSLRESDSLRLLMNAIVLTASVSSSRNKKKIILIQSDACDRYHCLYPHYCFQEKKKKYDLVLLSFMLQQGKKTSFGMTFVN